MNMNTVHLIDPSEAGGCWANLLLLLRRAEPPALFSRIPVVRSSLDRRATATNVPSHCWVLNQEITNTLPPAGVNSGIETILIRDEFLAAFKDTISCYCTGFHAWTTTHPQPQPQDAALDTYPALSTIDNPFTAQDLTGPRAVWRGSVILTGQRENGMWLLICYSYRV